MPVYFGAPDVSKYVNTGRFVLCLEGMKTEDIEKQMKSEDDIRKLLKPCLEEVLRLDQDEKAYLEKLNQPFLKDNVFEGSIFDYGYYGKTLKRVIETSKGKNEALKL